MDLKKCPSVFSVGDGMISGERTSLECKTKNYTKQLGLTSPWTVSEVKLDMPSQEIRVRVEHPRGTMFCCQNAKKQLSCYDHARSVSGGTWTHASSNHPHWSRSPSRVPRAWREVGRCPLGRTASRFTIMFERFAIEVLLMTQTVKGAKTIFDFSGMQLGTSLNGLSNVVRPERNRRYYRELASTRKHFSKGQKYVSILYNIDNSTVEAIQEGMTSTPQKLVFPS